MKSLFNSRYLYLILLGILSSLSLPPFNYFLINFITFSLFFYFLVKQKNDVKKINFFIYGWSFGFGYFITNLYWINISLTFDADFKILIPISFLLIPSFLALFYGLATYLFYFFRNKKILSLFFLFALLFGITEFIRGHVLTGFPWNLIIFSFSNQIKFLNIISIVGTYGFNIFCISLFITPALFFLIKDMREIIVCTIFLISPIFIYIYGNTQFERFNNIEKKTNDFVIRAISSNISLDRFYNEVETSTIIQDLIRISEPQLNKKILFLWPEGVIPDVSQDQLINYKYLFENEFNNNHLVGLGINNQNNDLSMKIYNSFSIYDNQLNLIDYYNKNNLVPFGEFLPFENLMRKIGMKNITNNYQSYSRGDKRKIIDLNKNNFSLRILPLICYEVIYTGKLYKNYNFDYLINISEDGWFGKSIGPKQHFAHSILRSIESGKYLVRAANNGTAAIINPLGIIEKQVDFGKNGFIDLEEVRETKPTIFSKFGNKVFGLIILLYIFLFFSFNRI